MSLKNLFKLCLTSKFSMFGIPIFLTLLFGGITIYDVFIKAKKPDIQFQIIDHYDLLSVKEDLEDLEEDLEIFYKGKIIKESGVYFGVVVIKVINTGNEDVSEFMYDRKIPFGFYVSGGDDRPISIYRPNTIINTTISEDGEVKRLRNEDIPLVNVDIDGQHFSFGNIFPGPLISYNVDEEKMMVSYPDKENVHISSGGKGYPYLKKESVFNDSTLVVNKSILDASNQHLKNFKLELESKIRNIEWSPEGKISRLVINSLVKFPYIILESGEYFIIKFICKSTIPNISITPSGKIVGLKSIKSFSLKEVEKEKLLKIGFLKRIFNYLFYLLIPILIGKIYIDRKKLKKYKETYL